MVYAMYNQNMPIIITIVVYKHISFIHLNMGELLGLKYYNYIFLSQLLGGGAKTYVRPPTFHNGGSPPLLALPLSTPLVSSQQITMKLIAIRCLRIQGHLHVNNR